MPPSPPHPASHAPAEQGLEQPTAADLRRSAEARAQAAAASCALAEAEALAAPSAARYSWRRLLQAVGTWRAPPADPRASSEALASVRRLLRRAADLLLWVK